MIEKTAPQATRLLAPACPSSGLLTHARVPRTREFADALLATRQRQPTETGRQGGFASAPAAPTNGEAETRGRVTHPAPKSPPPGAADDDDALSLLRQAARLAPPVAVSAGAPVAAAPLAAPVIDGAVRALLPELMTSLVRRIAWGGDARRGSVRIELSGGALAGATLVVHAEGGRVQVELDTPPGADVSRWTERLALCLDARGVDVASLDVR